eukprot:scpid34397/ scgid32470/ 
MPHSCTVPGCQNVSGAKKCKRGYRRVQDGTGKWSMEEDRLCGNTAKRVGCRGACSVCRTLPFAKFPKPLPESADPHLAKRQRKLIKSWKDAVRKQNLTVTATNDVRVSGAHFPALQRQNDDEVPSVFAWTIPVMERQTLTSKKASEAEEESMTVDEEEVASTEDTGEVDVVEENQRLRDEILDLKSQLELLKDQNTILEAQLERQHFTARQFTSDKNIRWYTGFRTFGQFEEMFKLVLSTRSATQARGTAPILPLEDCFFIAMVKVWKDYPEEELARLTGVSQPTISRIIRHWIPLAANALRQIPIFPSRSQVDELMSLSFREMYPRTRIIIDALEIPIEKPKNPTTQAATWSEYKQRNTVKALVGITPGGALSFVSQLYGGRTSDKELVRRCELLKLLDKGDVIMADKGFDIASDALVYGVGVNIPPFLHHQQFSEEDLLTTRRIASLRIHVERAIQQIKNYSILRFLPISMADIGDEIFSCCALLTLFNPPLM